MKMQTGATILGGFDEAQVSALTGVSVRQLRFWSRSGFYSPAMDPAENAALPVGLYDFRDLVCLKVIGLLRNRHKVSLAHLRLVKSELHHLGPHLWADTTLYILGRKVVFDNPATGLREEVSSGQGVLSIPLKLVSGEMEEAARASRARREGTAGLIERRRGVMNSRPVIAGTRILVETIIDFCAAGHTAREIIQEFPTLVEKDISAAINFQKRA